MFNNSWDDFFTEETKKEYFSKLMEFVDTERKNGNVYPEKERVFDAFRAVPVEKVKVVIIGQDPYHGKGQAHGMAFSVLPGVPKPPSLKNIFKEISEELALDIPDTGYLQPWAEQGVFLLNAVLTVREEQADSHKGKGWENFTSSAIALLNKENSPKVFMLWGKKAQVMEKLIDNPHHLLLKSGHPSPLSARQGFFGCGHFRLANEFLEEKGLSPIDWKL